MRNMRAMADTEYTTPSEIASLIPKTSPRSVQMWAKKGQIEGAVLLPSRRWLIPWSGVIKLLGFDPRRGPQSVTKPAEPVVSPVPSSQATVFGTTRGQSVSDWPEDWSDSGICEFAS